MRIDQIAQAILNDPATSSSRARALDSFKNDGHWDGAVHFLLVAVYTEMKKPIYAGVQFDGTAWQAAAQILEAEIDHAIAAKQGA